MADKPNEYQGPPPNGVRGDFDKMIEAYQEWQAAKEQADKLEMEIHNLRQMEYEAFELADAAKRHFTKRLADLEAGYIALMDDSPTSDEKDGDE